MQSLALYGRLISAGSSRWRQSASGTTTRPQNTRLVGRSVAPQSVVGRLVGHWKGRWLGLRQEGRAAEADHFVCRCVALRCIALHAVHGDRILLTAQCGLVFHAGCVPAQLRGVRRCTATIDGRPLYRHGRDNFILIRKALGIATVEDPGQLIQLFTAETSPPLPALPLVDAYSPLPGKAYRAGCPVSQDCEVAMFPTGFVFKFRLEDSWGDPYYVGLNGLQLYGPSGKPLQPSHILARVAGQIDKQSS